MTKKQLGSYLMNARHSRNLTQSQMAELVDVSLRYYQSLEAGENDPSFETLKKISVGLKLPPNELFGFSQPDKKPDYQRALFLLSRVSPDRVEDLIEFLDELADHSSISTGRLTTK